MDGFIMSVRRGRSLGYRLSKKIMPGAFQVYLHNKSSGVRQDKNVEKSSLEVTFTPYLEQHRVRLLEAAP